MWLYWCFACGGKLLEFHEHSDHFCIYIYIYTHTTKSPAVYWQSLNLTGFDLFHTFFPSCKLAERPRLLCSKGPRPTDPPNPRRIAGRRRRTTSRRPWRPCVRGSGGAPFGGGRARPPWRRRPKARQPRRACTAFYFRF